LLSIQGVSPPLPDYALSGTAAIRRKGVHSGRIDKKKRARGGTLFTPQIS